MVYYFYFLLVGSRRNEYNSLLGREGGEVRSLLLTLFAMLNLFSSFTDEKMILQFIAVHDTFIIILSQYIVFINACHTLHDAHLAARIPRHSRIRMYDKYKGDFFTFLENDTPLYFYCSLKRVPNFLDDTFSE